MFRAKRSFAAISLILFGLSVILLIAWTIFESAFAGMSTAAERIVTFVMLVLPAGVGAVLYLLGELHRARGDLGEAEQAYRQAHLHGRSPQPGLSLLQLLRGETGAAVAAIRRVLHEAAAPRSRPRTPASSRCRCRWCCTSSP